LKKLPEFVLETNATLKGETNKTFSFGSLKEVKACSKESLQTPWGIEQTFKLALSAVDGLKLGKGKDTDLLMISLSSHDYLGHRFGPNHENMEAMTVEEDRLISKFLNDLSSRLPGGLNDVFLVLTGDHGMPPSALPKERVPSENIPDERLTNLAEKVLTQAFGKPKTGHWVEANIEFQLFLDQESIKSAGIPMGQIVKVLRDHLVKEPYIDQVWGRDEILDERKVPAGEYGIVADRTLSRRSGDIIVVLKPYFYSDPYYHVTHMTFYSYDRYVPLVFFGRTFKPGLYRQIVNVVDIAPTLSRVLDVLPPSQSEGRVLTEILR
jgi:predicted AlkP superfamily pyrophosphatase or phosphodiesterase